MESKTKAFLSLASVLILLYQESKAGNNILLAPGAPYDRDFNFHDKQKFLKDEIKKLIRCIQPGPKDPPITPAKEPLKKSSKGSPNGKDRYVFEYNGTRKYNETCLGDTYKRDFLRRLYDANCMEYVDKVKFLDAVSCDATQNLECRQIGVEPSRQFAEQATPIMRCLCPDYSKSQAHLSDNTRGYFCTVTKQCVLKTGQICTIHPKALDARLSWNDFDYDGNNDKVAEGIDVADLRPMNSTYPCVKNAFCYTGDNNGLGISEVNINRCCCEAGYFPGSDRLCHAGRDSPSGKGLFLAIVMYSIGIITFIAVMLI